MRQQKKKKQKKAKLADDMAKMARRAILWQGGEVTRATKATEEWGEENS